MGDEIDLLERTNWDGQELTGAVLIVFRNSGRRGDRHVDRFSDIVEVERYFGNGGWARR